MPEKPQFTSVNEDFEGERNAKITLLDSFLFYDLLGTIISPTKKTREPTLPTPY